MNRFSDWERRYSNYIESVKQEEFSYGFHDCCTFSAGNVIAITGWDPMEEYRGKYHTLLGARKLMKRKQLKTLWGDKFEEVAKSFAQRGDLALYDSNIGVVDGSFAWFVSDAGLEKVLRKDWQKAWKVGRG